MMLEHFNDCTNTSDYASIRIDGQYARIALHIEDLDYVPFITINLDQVDDLIRYLLSSKGGDRQ